MSANQREQRFPAVIRWDGCVIRVSGPHAGPSLSAPGRIRTSDTRFRKPLLFPLSYGGGLVGTLLDLGFRPRADQAADDE